VHGWQKAQATGDISGYKARKKCALSNMIKEKKLGQKFCFVLIMH